MTDHDDPDVSNDPDGPDDPDDSNDPDDPQDSQDLQDSREYHTLLVKYLSTIYLDPSPENITGSSNTYQSYLQILLPLLPNFI